MDEFLFFLKINRAQKKEFIRTCTRKEWKEEKKTDVGWFEQTWNSMRKAGKDFLAPSCMEGPCSLTHNVDLHPLSDEKEWVGDWGIDWLVYANVFLISRSFPVKQQRQRRRKFKKKKKVPCFIYSLARSPDSSHHYLQKDSVTILPVVIDRKKNVHHIFPLYSPSWHLIV